MDCCVSKLQLPKLQGVGGVYSIECQANGKRYVGSTNNLYDRARVHRSLLFMGMHTNKLLQSDYKAFGPENFSFDVIALVGCVHERLALEKKCIYNLAKHRRYNFVRKSGKHNPGMSYKVRVPA